MTASSPTPGPAASPAQRQPHLIHLAVLGTLLWSLTLANSAHSSTLPQFQGAWMLHDVESGYGSPGAASTLDSLVALGAGSVGLVPYGYQLSRNSPFIEASAGSSWSTSDRALIDTILMAQARGLRVLLMPKLSLHKGQATEIEMGDEEAWRKWFGEYGRWLNHYAELSERYAVDLLVVGSELTGSTHLERQWRELIAAARRRYGGPLSYSAHWSGELEQIRFWDALDAIGLAMYGPVSSRQTASFEEVHAAIVEQTQRLAAACRRWERPGVISEVGFRSVGDGRKLTRRDGRIGGRSGEELQALAYRAVGEVLSDPPWLRGLLWNGWSSDSEIRPSSEEQRRSFSVRGKLAQAELRAIWHDPKRVALAARPRGRGGMVVSSDPTATRVGVEILRAGGNAVDAAIATAFALAVTEPQAASLGGGGFLLAKEANRRPWALDFREMAPFAAEEHQYMAWELRGDNDARHIGPRSAAIAGNVAGYYRAWRQGGHLPWPQLVHAAQALAEDGFAVSPRLARDIESAAEKLKLSPMSRSLFFDHGEGLKAGSWLRQPELASLLQHIASQGEKAFYEGPVADALARELRAGGGIWNAEDLHRYRTRRLEPVEIAIGPRESLLALDAPSAGATVLAQSFYFLRRQQADSMSGAGPERARALIESLRLAMADRNGHLADPAVMKIQPRSLRRRDYMRRRARMLPAYGPGDSELVAAGEASRASDETTHIVVFDAEGRCASLSTSLSGSFGSGWSSPSTGIVLNAAMGDFSAGDSNPNRIRPGARMLSSMSPVIVLADGESWLALGGRGGNRILSALLQVITHRIWDDWPLDQAIAAPRLHHEWMPDQVEIENTRPWPGIAEDLMAMGYPVLGVGIAAKIHGIERLSDGSFVGVCDPRDAGLASPAQELPAATR